MYIASQGEAMKRLDISTPTVLSSSCETGTIAMWSAAESQWWLFLTPKGTEHASLNFFGARLWIARYPTRLQAWALRTVFGIAARRGTCPDYILRTVSPTVDIGPCTLPKAKP